MNKDHMFWGNAVYSDGKKTRVPRPTYRCRAKAKGHQCKKVTDHDGPHECVCNREIGEKVIA